jgi:thiamine-phosphate pyrophosphorylase
MTQLIENNHRRLRSIANCSPPFSSPFSGRQEQKLRPRTSSGQVKAIIRAKLRRGESVFPALYAIIDSGQERGAAVSLAKALADAGVRLIQLRDKRASARVIYEVSRELNEAMAPRGVRLIVNDRPDIAAMIGAGGVHVGQEDLPVEEARKICVAGRWVGVSTHNMEQFLEAERTSADYIAVGPIFATATKENPDPVVGLEFLLAVRRLTQKPLVAIGGITIESAEAVYCAGADSVAVVRDLISAADPAQRAREYFAIAERVLSRRAGTT